MQQNVIRAWREIKSVATISRNNKSNALAMLHDYARQNTTENIHAMNWRKQGEAAHVRDWERGGGEELQKPYIPQYMKQIAEPYRDYHVTPQYWKVYEEVRQDNKAIPSLLKVFFLCMILPWRLVLLSDYNFFLYLKGRIQINKYINSSRNWGINNLFMSTIHFRSRIRWKPKFFVFFLLNLHELRVL